MPKIFFYTLGCKVNSYETQGMLEACEKAGFELAKTPAASDYLIVNSCTVTQMADKKTRQLLHQLRKDNPKAIIAVCGCYAEKCIAEEEGGIKTLTRPGHQDFTVFELSNEADLWIPNSMKKQLPSLLCAYAEGNRDKILNETEPLFEDLSISTQEDRSRADLKVQDGCRQFCTYCIIPYVRGPLVSKPVETCLREAESLVANGFKELVLTGIHLSSYKDGDKDLGDLIVRLNKIPNLERIRLGSLEPGIITEVFLAKAKSADKLCPHFHLALQSGCDNTLKAMNRRYGADEFRKAVSLLRAQYPVLGLTTDVIVGFPGETEEDHRESLAFVEEMGFTALHVFRYSKREGTPAAQRKDQVPGPLKKRRSEEMLALGERLEQSYLESKRGTELEVLIEEEAEEENTYFGHTKDYLLVKAELREGAAIGSIVRVTAIKVQKSEKGTYLLAKDKVKEAAMNSDTQFFKPYEAPETQAQAVLQEVIVALQEKGYHPENQITGYLMSGDPSYITSYNNSRNKITRIGRDELVEELIVTFMKYNGLIGEGEQQ